MGAMSTYTSIHPIVLKTAGPLQFHWKTFSLQPEPLSNCSVIKRLN